MLRTLNENRSAIEPHITRPAQLNKDEIVTIADKNLSSEMYF